MTPWPRAGGGQRGTHAVVRAGRRVDRRPPRGLAVRQGRLLTFGYGGTSTDVAPIDGEPRLTTEGHIGRFPVAVPMVDMHTIGAGGGSIAWVDAGGMLQVGPQSAGAEPGPACYGRANPAHGYRRQPGARSSAARCIPGRRDASGCRRRERRGRYLADAMGTTRMRAALDVIAVANEHMAQAPRAIAVRRAPTRASMCWSRSAVPVGCMSAQSPSCWTWDSAMVPVHGGVLSALGMLAARPGRQLSRTRIGLLAEIATDDIESMFSELRAQGWLPCRRRVLPRPTVTIWPAWICGTRVSRTRSICPERHPGNDRRLSCWPPGTLWAPPDLPVELVNLRLRAGPVPALRLAGLPRSRRGAVRLLPCRRGQGASAAVLAPCLTSAGPAHPGAALVAEKVATTWVTDGWVLEVDEIGNLQLRRRAAVPSR